MILFRLFILACSSSIPVVVHAARFAVSGPIVTVTLKDTPSSSSSSSSSLSAYPTDSYESDDSGYNVDEPPPSDPIMFGGSGSGPKKWVDIAGLNPSVLWSIQSQSAPLPNWLPALTSIRANIGYRYNELRKMPSFVEGALRFRVGGNTGGEASSPVASGGKVGSGIELQLQPSHEFKSKQSNLLVQITRGMSSYLLARFSTNNLGGNNNSGDDYHGGAGETNYFQKDVLEALDFVRGSYCVNLPHASLSSIRVTPSYDFPKQEPACNIEAVTGGSGRTKAVLNLEYNNPTLSVVHALDEKNVIAPEINLYTARIVYHWNLKLSEGCALKTKVDPTSAIHVTWMDKSTGQNGRWVTDVKLPLEGTTIQALAADVKVRRQFHF